MPGLSMAQVQGNQTIGYQGRLLKADGTPMNGQLSITFKIYDKNGTVLWTEPRNVTPNPQGFYAVFLGSATAFPANLFDGSDRYLGITVGTDRELTPRQKIASVAYAIQATHADSATNAAHAVAADSAASATRAEAADAATTATNVSGSGSVAARSVDLTSSNDEGPPLLLVNAKKTGSGIANTWAIWNMTGPYGNALQFWSYDDVACGGGLCGAQMKIADTGGVWISGALTQNSRRATKTRIRELELEDAMRALRGLRPVRYEYRADPGNEQVGFVAEEMPTLLSTKDRAGVRALDVVAVLTRVLQAQQAEIAELKARLDSRGR